MSEIIIPDPPDWNEGRELAALRKQTKQFIREEFTDLEIERPQIIDDGAGGKRDIGPTYLPAQRARVIQQREGQSTERRTASGEVVKPSLSVLFEWDADVQVGDFMVWNGYRIEVVWITERKYEKTAEVVVR